MRGQKGFVREDVVSIGIPVVIKNSVGHIGYVTYRGLNNNGFRQERFLAGQPEPHLAELSLVERSREEG